MNSSKATFLYIRITDKEQGSEASESQALELTEWCKKNQITNFQIFADHGAARLSEERPAYSRMIEKVKAGECSTIVIASLSRFSRSKQDLLIALEIIRDNRVRFVSLTDDMDTSATLGIPKFLQCLMKMEKEVIGERLYSGRKKSAAPAIS